MDTEPVSLIDVPAPKEATPWETPPPPEPPKEAPEAGRAPLAEGSGSNADVSA